MVCVTYAGQSLGVFDTSKAMEPPASPNCVRCADASELWEWSSEVPFGRDTPCSPLVLLSRVAMSILALAVEETTGSRLVLLLWMGNIGLLALSEL